MKERAAWKELKDVVAALPIEDLPTFFHGSTTERDDLMDRLGWARETSWLVGVLRLSGDDG